MNGVGIFFCFRLICTDQIVLKGNRIAYVVLTHNLNSSNNATRSIKAKSFIISPNRSKERKGTKKRKQSERHCTAL